jgi:hypothetical protein
MRAVRFLARIPCHSHAEHGRVVHEVDRQGHDDRSQPDRGGPFQPPGQPQRGRGRHDGDRDGRDHVPDPVDEDDFRADRGHPHVVHGRDARAREQPGERELQRRVPAEADHEQAAGGHGDGDEGAERGQGGVVEDRRVLDGEADHRDEVHDPDAGAADGERGHDQPQRALPGLVVAAGVPRHQESEGRSGHGHQERDREGEVSV